MSSAARRLQRALQKHLGSKLDVPDERPGRLGTFIDGTQYVRVPNRRDFVYVRLYGRQSELIQAFNDKVGDYFDLPVIVVRDASRPNSYRVKDRDSSIYGNWSGLPATEFHAFQHTFVEESEGRDPVWIDKRQIMPLNLRPGDITGSMSAYVDPDYFYWYDGYKHWDGGETVDFTAAKPPVGYAYFITVYLDGDTNTLAYLSGTYTDPNSAVENPSSYIAFLPPGVGIPTGAVYLDNTTNHIDWDNLYNIRTLVSGGIPFPNLHQVLFTVEGTIATGSKTIRVYNNFGLTKVITKVFLAANTAPGGQAIIIDVNKGGVTIFTNQANRPQIAAAANTGQTTTIDVPNWAVGEYLQIDVDQAGSAPAGSDLTVHIIVR